MRGFAEKVALVTNGAHGVGRAVALQLALAGAYVVVSYHPDDEAGGQVLHELREMGTLAHAVAADVSRAEGASGLFGAVDDAFSRLDLLVHVSGPAAAMMLGEIQEAEWERVIGRDLKSAFLCAQLAAPLMKQRPAPAIVNVAAAAGVAGQFGGAHHHAAGAGLVGLTRALAGELERVRVNCVIAGRAESGETLVEADEVARACLYLLSPEARRVNGQVVTVGDER